MLVSCNRLEQVKIETHSNINESSSFTKIFNFLLDYLGFAVVQEYTSVYEMDLA